jgi:chromosome segregation ATPase
MSSAEHAVRQLHALIERIEAMNLEKLTTDVQALLAALGAAAADKATITTLQTKVTDLEAQLAAANAAAAEGQAKVDALDQTVAAALTPPAAAPAAAAPA